MKGWVREREEERGTSRRIPPSYSAKNRRNLEKEKKQTNKPNKQYREDKPSKQNYGWRVEETRARGGRGQKQGWELPWRPTWMIQIALDWTFQAIIRPIGNLLFAQNDALFPRIRRVYPLLLICMSCVVCKYKSLWGFLFVFFSVVVVVKLWHSRFIETPSRLCGALEWCESVIILPAGVFTFKAGRAAATL